ncbi:MAG TPA: hypothetical protein VGV37_09685 [Aliidongia sp.]|uniref:hypothetical protein n=1 Tax=Aliidongia sp. TaxID=1914230 RepID=UPI002DDD46A1|nr:hypothetical protein [Aliidongia sp.]HEV2674802.1 hypothetical protein [Aliidongia sp.]
MPNFDGGHYFLTVLAPIETDRLVEHDGLRSSAVHMVQSTLATLPTARQTEATEWLRLGSPFARSTRTHFARFVVINDTVFNGRDPIDALRVSLVGPNPVIPFANDRLTTPFLLFTADFDAASDDPGELRSYLVDLWTKLEPELSAIFQYCVGFGTGRTAESFADYIIACQIETTMPFNDYWTGAPPLTSLKDKLCTMAGVVALGALVAVPILHAFGWTWGWSLLAALAAGIVLVLGIGYEMVERRASTPFPRAPHCDLPSVLKALYLQQQFSRLAIDAQGQDDATLHALFGQFLATHRPGDLNGPTQLPGVIGATGAKAS